MLISSVFYAIVNHFLPIHQFLRQAQDAMKPESRAIPFSGIGTSGVVDWQLSRHCQTASNRVVTSITTFHPKRCQFVLHCCHQTMPDWTSCSLLLDSLVHSHTNLCSMHI